MVVTKKDLLTADDLLRLYSKGVKGELIRGVLAQTVPAGGEHGEIAMTLGSALLAFVKPGRLGRVFGTDSGVWLENDPDVVREPDVAFISAEKLPLSIRNPGYYRGSPDLVAEIVSPTDTAREVYDKARMWLSHGVTLVWVVHSGTRTVDVYSLGSSTSTLMEDDTLEGGAALPGFTLPVREIFE